MSDSIQKFLDFHKEAGGTGKLFNFKLVKYKEDYLELDGEFPDETLNPDGSVQGGMMTSMLDDVTALLLIIKSNASIYPSSTNLHSHHHRPLFKGKVTAKAFLIKQGKTIASVRGEIYDDKGRLATTLMHTVFIQKRS
jgi:acyl-CoA thioesterase